LLILGPQKALLNLRRFRWFSEEPENFDYFCRLCLSATVEKEELTQGPVHCILLIPTTVDNRNSAAAKIEPQVRDVLLGLKFENLHT